MRNRHIIGDLLFKLRVIHRFIWTDKDEFIYIGPSSNDPKYKQIIGLFYFKHVYRFGL